MNLENKLAENMLRFGVKNLKAEDVKKIEESVLNEAFKDERGELWTVWNEKEFEPKLKFNHDNFKNTDHVHHFSWYVGNYPTLEREKIDTLIDTLNNI